MFGTVTLPVWLFALILLFAAVAALSHVLIPSVRWFFRRRMEAVVAELNKRLAQPIRPFKLMRRNDMIIRLVHDPGVMAAVVAEATETGEPESVVFARAKHFAREIVPSFSAALYFGWAAWLARKLSRLLYKVRVGRFDAARLDQIDREATVVFVMNHRSNMDYVLVTHLASERTSLSYAVGEWARLWPLSSLIRSMGAYFIRRKSNNPLYRKVLARYVQMATEEGVTQAIFPEGGLSLDGALGPPKLGLFSYILAGFDPVRSRDVVFVPVALAYDRVLEDRVLTEAHARGIRRFAARWPVIFGFVLRNGWRALRGKFKPFGYAAVSFGAPLSLKEFLSATPGAVAEALGVEMMRRIADEMPALPVPLVAAAMQGHGPRPRAAVAAEVAARVTALRAAGDAVVPGRRPDDIAELGIAPLALRGILADDGTILTITPGNEALIAYYSAAIPDKMRGSTLQSDVAR